MAVSAWAFAGLLASVLPSLSATMPIASLAQLGVSGDHYPQQLPQPSDASLFAGKRVLFAIDHGVEDHEVYYQHQYFTDRGAVVLFARPGGGSILLSDFFNPSHAVNSTIDLNSVELSTFDAVFVAGGLPSSAGLRRSSFPTKLASFVRSGGPGKLAALICSGNEVLVESGLLQALKGWPTSSAPDVLMKGVATQTSSGDVVGSPASVPTMDAAVAQMGGRYLANDPKTQYVAYPSQGSSALLVLGKNPNASPAFVTAIGNLWAKAQERMPGSYDQYGNWQAAEGEGVPLHVKPVVGYRATFKNAQASSDGSFFGYDAFPKVLSPPLSDLTSLAVVKTYTMKNRSDAMASTGLHLVLAASSGTESSSLLLLREVLLQAGATVQIGCPSWFWPWKDGDVYLFTEPPVAPQEVLKCDVAFNAKGVCPIPAGCSQAQQPTMPDALLVPSGLFATHGVLRNDADLQQLIRGMADGKRLLAALGSGVETLSASLTSRRCILAAGDADVAADVTLQGNVAERSATEVGPQGACPSGARVLTTSATVLDEFVRRLLSSMARNSNIVV